ncbi:Vacuolar protein sorting-associated protein 37A [Gonapodya sp. JEL0774]|nr:Vacuolar protein sorting-associated protein 37A [Gonapodya sp. JEL0774]
MTTALQQRRQDQIQTVLKEIKNVRILIPNERFEIKFALPAPLGTIFVLFLNLPPDFPNVKPVLTFQTPVSHPLVNSDTRQVTGKPQLSQAWNINQNLGKIIRDLIEEFQRNPPYVLDVGPVGPLDMVSSVPAGRNGPYPPVPDRMSAPNGYSATPAPYLQHPLPTMPPSDLEDDLLVLNQMSDSDLQELVESEDAFTALFESLPRIESMRRTQERITQQTEKVAAAALALEPTYRTTYSSLRNQLEQIEGGKREMGEMLGKQRVEMGKFSVPNLLTALSREVEDADKQSRDIIQSFLQPGHGDERITFDEFLRQYREARKLYHLRRAKMEMLQRGTGGVGGRGR